jgi:hypothetical protein
MLACSGFITGQGNKGPDMARVHLTDPATLTAPAADGALDDFIG